VRDPIENAVQDFVESPALHFMTSYDTPLPSERTGRMPPYFEADKTPESFE